MIHIFGIRHHGPGSARSLRQALTQLQPDIVLVEGPPDAEAVLPLLAEAQMCPPVALLLYNPDRPQQAVYYPFAVFSPEWQAIHYALTQQIPVRLMDLPQAHRFAMAEGGEGDKGDEGGEEGEGRAGGEHSLLATTHSDPLSLLAAAAGYSDSERWWEHLVEQRQDSTEVFTAILEAMTVLRSHLAAQSPPPAGLPLEAQREAYMRKTIRAAEKQGFQRIAVVCGAWHAPALATMPPVKADTALLKGLPKQKVAATWVPWTYGRLTMASGYGAGVESPGWYHHLWEMGHGESTIRWLTKVAQLLRHQDLDASPASVIAAVRLAETLAALRDRPVPGLPELNEATQTVLCGGETLPLQLIQQQLIVGERLGTVPEVTPMPPLQQDLQHHQKRLRLPPKATETTLNLDLRQPLDLERSQLLHRLRLLQIHWGQPQATGNAKGTFRESWKLQWQPEFVIRLIEAGIWGNAIATATTAWVCDRAQHANLPTLTELIDQTLLAQLPDAIAHLMLRLESEAAIASDLTHLMQALPPLANVLRYGTVRQLDTAIVEPVVTGLVTRICIGLPIAVASLDVAAATERYPQIVAVHGAIGLLAQPELQTLWQQVLSQLADQQGLHGLIAGRCCRLLLEAGIFTAADTAQRLAFALSTATAPTQAAAWIEGFLTGSGLLLLHNPTLWQLLEDWVMQLSPETFTTLLPLLRRTFSTFAAPERRQMGERVRQVGREGVGVRPQPGNFDRDRADAVLPLIAQLLGLN